MSIHLLDTLVVSKIAAGEVVERPASAVKELVENSLDAGATRITIEVQGGGLQSIRVVDDGSGIPANEAALAFERHATSKLTSADDLMSITSLGFRGEALPSIAAVSQVSLLTRPSSAQAGTLVEAREGNVEGKKSQGSPPGTSIVVRRLFQNVPARLKFLRSEATELGHIQDLVNRFALCFPSVAFSLEIDGRKALASPGTGDDREAAAAVYGANVAADLVEIAHDEADDATYRVSGLVSPPSLHRANRNAISLFVNGRWVQNRSLTFAVAEAYQNLLPERRNPIAILRIAVPLEEVDVNVHPTKREVRFRREGDVFSAVQKAVRSTLVDSAPVAAFRAQGQAFGAAAGLSPWRPPPRPVAGQGALDLIPWRGKAGVDSGRETPRSILPVLRVLGQIQTTYIVAEGPDGMYLIDQHAGHEQVVYERVRDQVAAGAAERQGLLEPAVVELTPALETALKSQQETLERYGFVLESFGEGACLVRAVPGAFRSRPGQALIEVLEAVLDGDQQQASREWRLAATVACHSAVRAGDVLSHQEMSELVRSLEVAQEPYTCPHGRPIIIHLSTASLEREFGRR
jgi:DNA mismatch repair protein MutL